MKSKQVVSALIGVLLLPMCTLAGNPMELLYVQAQPSASSNKAPTVTGHNWQGQNTSNQNGAIIYRARGSETLKQIAQRVYGDASLWPIIYNANKQKIQSQRLNGVNDTVDLIIPPPPSSRVFQHEGKYYVKVRPGDTFRSLSQAIYGTDEMWRHLYEANKDILQSPQVAAAMAQHGSRVTLIFRVPAPNASYSQNNMPNFPSQVNHSQVPDSYQVSDQQASPGRLNGTGTDISRLNLRGPQDIGRREAEIILRDTGFICSRNPTFERAMRALRIGYYRKGSTSLDATNKERLFELYTWHREALAKYGNHPTVSSRATPQLYNQWVTEASQYLTAVPASQRETLMRSLMTTESGKTQWSNYKPIISNCGAVGFGQFLPATAKGIGINPFDPQQNIHGIAKYLNKLIKRHGLRKGLAAYNGGGRPPASSYRYADRILSRAGMAA